MSPPVPKEEGKGRSPGTRGWGVWKGGKSFNGAGVRKLNFLRSATEGKAPGPLPSEGSRKCRGPVCGWTAIHCRPAAEVSQVWFQTWQKHEYCNKAKL